PGCRRSAGGRASCRRALLGAAESRAVRRQGADRARPGRAGGTGGAGDRLRRCLHRAVADDLGAGLLQARLQMMRRVALVAAAVVLLVAVVQLQAARERWYPAQDVDDAALYLRSPGAVRRLAGAYAPLAADLYWI